MSRSLKHSNFSQITSLVILIIIEMSGIGLVIPLLPALFILPSSPFLNIVSSTEVRNLLYGIALGIWPIGMFFGTPFLGELSDRIGRKKIFISCLLATTVFYALSALAIHAHNVILFFLCRLFSGFFAGTYEIAQAAAADLSTPETKARNLGWTITALNIGFIVGPAITTAVTFATSNHSLNLTMPFVIASILALGNAILMLVYFRETYIPKEKSEIKLKKIFFAFLFVFRDRRVRFIGVIFFAAVIGWIEFFTGMPLLLSERYGQTTKMIAVFFVTGSFSSLLCQFSLQSKLLKLFHLRQITIVSLLLSAIALGLISLQTHLVYAWCFALFFIFVEVMAYTCVLALASNAVSTDEQGRVMGGMATISSLGFCLASLLTGAISSINILLPLIVAAFCYFMATIGMAYLTKRSFRT